jgi:hypothetical protein
MGTDRDVFTVRKDAEHSAIVLSLSMLAASALSKPILAGQAHLEGVERLASRSTESSHPSEMCNSGHNLHNRGQDEIWLTQRAAGEPKQIMLSCIQIAENNFGAAGAKVDPNSNVLNGLGRPRGLRFRFRLLCCTKITRYYDCATLFCRWSFNRGRLECLRLLF